jgi:phenylacetate-coenzyme A ligase PaaK-like adenylate-forming protein
MATINKQEYSYKNKKIALRLGEILKFSLNGKNSHFYLQKYRNFRPDAARFSDIPLLKKRELLRTDPDDISFFQKKHITHYSVDIVSGEPLVLPQGASEYAKNALLDGFTKEKMRRLRVRQAIIMVPVYSDTYYRYVTMPKKPAVVVAGYMTEPSLSAAFAKEIGVDGIICEAHAFRGFIDAAKKHAFDLGAIKWVLLIGSPCSNKDLTYFKKELKNAFFSMSYFVPEIGVVGYRCDFFNKKELPGAYHPCEDIFIEVVGKKGEDLPQGRSGDLVFTDLRPKAFTAIRYANGDSGRLESCNCPCGNKLKLTVLGV